MAIVHWMPKDQFDRDFSGCTEFGRAGVGQKKVCRRRYRHGYRGNSRQYGIAKFHFVLFFPYGKNANDTKDGRG
jgi:hypothetical protein